MDARTKKRMIKIQPKKTKIISVIVVCFLLFITPFIFPKKSSGETNNDERLFIEDTFEDPFETEQPGAPEKIEIYDPLEGLNRIIFQFNDFVYVRIVDPAARGYKMITPRPVRSGVSNFFSNLSEPLYFVNALLQGEGSDAHTAFARFLVNSTFGLGGLFDVVGDEPEQAPRHFDQTLARWGVGQGIYIVWPLWGPATLRSSFAWGGDSVFDPTWHTSFEKATKAKVVYGLNEAPEWLQEYERMKQYMLEPYSGVKNAYSEHTRYQFER